MCLHAPLPLLLGSLLYSPSKAWPSWLSTPTELTNQWRNYKSIAVLTLLNLRKKKKKAFYVNTQASTGLAGFLKNTRKKFCHDLAVRPPHPLYPPLPLPPAPVETESRCGWWKLFPTIQGVGWCWIWSHCPERPTEDWIESAIWVSSDAELLCEGSRVQ